MITLLDFGTVEAVNLDRLLHAGSRDVRLARAKVEVPARALRRSATAEHPRIEGLDLSWLSRRGWRGRWTATCCSAASTSPGPELCST